MKQFFITHFIPGTCFTRGLLAAIMVIAAAPGLLAAPASRYPYRLLISDMLSQKILILEKDGLPSWELEQPGWVMDGEQLSNGNVLYCWFEPKKPDQSGIREVTPARKVGWTMREQRILLLTQILP